MSALRRLTAPALARHASAPALTQLAGPPPPADQEHHPTIADGAILFEDPLDFDEDSDSVGSGCRSTASAPANRGFRSSIASSSSAESLAVRAATPSSPAARMRTRLQDRVDAVKAWMRRPASRSSSNTRRGAPSTATATNAAAPAAASPRVEPAAAIQQESKDGERECVKPGKPARRDPVMAAFPLEPVRPSTPAPVAIAAAAESGAATPASDAASQPPASPAPSTASAPARTSTPIPAAAARPVTALGQASYAAALWLIERHGEAARDALEEFHPALFVALPRLAALALVAVAAAKCKPAEPESQGGDEAEEEEEGRGRSRAASPAPAAALRMLKSKLQLSRKSKPLASCTCPTPARSDDKKGEAAAAPACCPVAELADPAGRVAAVAARVTGLGMPTTRALLLDPGAIVPHLLLRARTRIERHRSASRSRGASPAGPGRFEQLESSNNSRASADSSAQDEGVAVGCSESQRRRAQRFIDRAAAAACTALSAPPARGGVAAYREALDGVAEVADAVVRVSGLLEDQLEGGEEAAAADAHAARVCVLADRMPRLLVRSAIHAALAAVASDADEDADGAAAAAGLTLVVPAPAAPAPDPQRRAIEMLQDRAVVPAWEAGGGFAGRPMLTL